MSCTTLRSAADSSGGKASSASPLSMNVLISDENFAACSGSFRPPSATSVLLGCVLLLSATHILLGEVPTLNCHAPGVLPGMQKKNSSKGCAS